MTPAPDHDSVEHALGEAADTLHRLLEECPSGNRTPVNVRLLHQMLNLQAALVLVYGRLQQAEARLAALESEAAP